MTTHRQSQFSLHQPRNRFSLAAEIQFVTLLISLVTASVSVLPLLPAWLAPELLALTLTTTTIDDRFDRVNRWAIWGGLMLDLVSPTPFGFVWLPYLVAAGCLQLVRRVGATAELPWLWPVWFAVTTLVSTAPAALLTQAWRAWVTTSLVTATWGVATVAFRRWALNSREPTT